MPSTASGSPTHSKATTTAEEDGLRRFCQEALRRGVSGCRAAFRCVTCGAFSRERHAQGIFTHNGDEPYVRTSGAQLFEAGNKGVQSHMRKEIVKEDEKRNHQVGGHVGAFKDHGNKIHKLVMDAPELAFYRKITEAAAAGDAPRAWPAPFSAAFHGTVHDENGAESMVLENLLAGYRCPCVMDLKMGTRTAQDDARMFKALKMQARDEVSGAASMGAHRLPAKPLFLPPRTALSPPPTGPNATPTSCMCVISLAVSGRAARSGREQWKI